MNNEIPRSNSPFPFIPGNVPVPPPAMQGPPPYFANLYGSFAPPFQASQSPSMLQSAFQSRLYFPPSPAATSPTSTSTTSTSTASTSTTSGSTTSATTPAGNPADTSQIPSDEATETDAKATEKGKKKYDPPPQILRVDVVDQPCTSKKRPSKKPLVESVDKQTFDLDIFHQVPCIVGIPKPPKERDQKCEPKLHSKFLNGTIGYDECILDFTGTGESEYVSLNLLIFFE